MKSIVRITGWVLLFGVLTLGSGCRYLTNRYYDLRDTVALGAGVTAENPVTGVVPPSLGLYLECTDLMHLGAIHYNGYTAELDLRGSYIGPECETRFGFLWGQMLKKNQAYEDAAYHNEFKNNEFPWCHRMESLGMRKYGQPAKRLHYEKYQSYKIWGSWLLHRGWQYWEYIGAEAAISEPLLTHFGVMLRAGVDISELSDFVLGWLLVDFKHDDMNSDEYTLYLGDPSCWGLKLTPAKPRRELAPMNENESIIKHDNPPVPETAKPEENVKAIPPEEVNHEVEQSEPEPDAEPAPPPSGGEQEVEEPVIDDETPAEMPPELRK